MNILKVSVVVLSVMFIISQVETVAFAAGPAPINLGASGDFVVLAKTGISTTGSTAIVGDIGLSPAAATYITGFSLILPAASAFSTSALVTGKLYAPGYADPTPAALTTAVLDMQTAYTDGAGRAATVTELGAGNIGGLTLAPGVYKWGTGLAIPTDVTLSGGASDVWIFQVAQNLNLSSGAKVVLAGGAQAQNIFWVVGGQTTIGTTAVMNGNILDQTAIVLNTGAQLNGRALAQTAVTFDANTVHMPTSAVVVTSVPTTSAVPAIPAASAIPATVVTSSSGSGYSTTTVVPTIPAVSAIPATSAVPALSSAQQERYDLFIALGASPSAAQNAAAQIPASVATSVVRPTSSAFGQQVRAIATSLKQGDRGDHVSALQQFLIAQGKGTKAATLGTVGATAYFGGVTRAALAEFQASVGIAPALGNFGPITRAYVSAHY